MTIDISGEWIIDGHPWDAPYAGRAKLNLRQSGTTIMGELVQLIDPFAGVSLDATKETEAYVDGEIIEHEDGQNHLVVLKRTNPDSSFRAVFAGVLNAECGTMTGTFMNTLRKGGSFVMSRRATLVDSTTGTPNGSI